MMMKIKVLLRGGGDLATGVAHRLFKSGMSVVITELEKPLVIRRTVAFASAVYDGEITIEGVRGISCKNIPEYFGDYIPVIIDPECKLLKEFNPHVLVDVTMRKYNMGTNIDMAPLVIALGPGFTAGVDVHRVIETQRGHFLGQILYEGSAEPDTGIPGEIGGESWKRIVRSPADGIFISEKNIGDRISEGELIGQVDNVEVHALLSGVLRGLIKTGLYVTKNLKIGDIDPRAKEEYINTISDKARSLGGSVLQAIMEEFVGRFNFQ